MVLNTIFLVREIRRNEQQDSFLNAVTHELKTPVASIRLYLQTLQTRELDAGEAPRVLPHHARGQRSAAAHDRAGAARRQRAVAVPARGADAASTWRDRAASAWSSRARAFTSTSSRWRTRTAPAASPVVLGNADELKAAVWNLIDNAVKYSPSDVRVDGRARGRSSTDRVAVRVSDRGIGISSTELKRIFRRFYRTPALGAVRDEGQRPRPVHRAIGRAESRRPRVRRERRRRPGQHAHDRAAQGARCLTCSASSSSKTNCTSPKGCGSTSRRRGTRPTSSRRGEGALERLLGGDDALRSRRPRRDAAGQGRLRGRRPSCGRRSSSCRC